jgi:uncharacterized membrane protein HdeD (DUF308 family)
MSTVQADRQPGLGPGWSMVNALAKNWWLLLLRGIAAVVFGVLAFVWPGLTLLTLVLFYGAFALVDGVLAVIAAIKGAHLRRVGGWLLSAFLGSQPGS